MADETKRRAGVISGQKRQRGNKERDLNIVSAYRLMCGTSQRVSERRRGKDFLGEVDYVGKNKAEVLASIAGISRRQIDNILKARANERIVEIDKHEAEVIGVVSSRLKDARKLNGFSIRDSAKKIRISERDLIAYESGMDVEVIPLRVISGAAVSYRVSIDWLFGLVERDTDEDDFVKAENLILKHQVNEVALILKETINNHQ